MAASDDTSFDPRRRLCPDGGCIGIIGSDGRCSVCGIADPGQGTASPSALAGDQGDDSADAGRDVDADEDSTHDGAASSPAFDPKRRLCSDEACIGVIGQDNRCSVCGREADR